MRLAGIFAAFAEELIEGVEKCCQRFPGASRCNHQRMFARAATCQVCDWTAVGCLKARRNQSRVAGENTSGRARKGLDYLPLTLFPVNIMHDAWNSLTIDA